MTNYPRQSHSVNRSITFKFLAILFLFMISFHLQSKNISPSNGAIIINEIDLTNNTVELYNPSSAMVNVSSWRLCRMPVYVTISGLQTTGSTLMMPGAYLVISWSEINPDNNELGLYLPTGSFGSSTSIVDYVQYGGIASPTRSQTAVAAGVWDDIMNFVPLPTTQMNTLNNLNYRARDARDTNSNHWWESFLTAGFLNICIDQYTLVNTYRIGNRERGQAIYITNGALESDQDVIAGANAFYASLTEITLYPDFEVDLGADFLAYIDGCFID